MANLVSSNNHIRHLLIGVLFGCFLAICFVIALFSLRVFQISSHLPTIPPAITTSLPISETPTPRLIMHIVSTSEFNLFLDQAERYVSEDYEPQKAVDMLKPLLDSLLTDTDLIRAHKVLSMAEAEMGHFQIAAGYAEKLYEIEPTAENLYFLASLYDMGGDLDRALVKYSFLYWSADEEADVYRGVAKERMDAISEVLYTPTPTPVE